MPKARLTCTQCSVRRQKCDRNVPCERCQTRGVSHLCTRVWPTADASRVHRGASRQHRRGSLNTEDHVGNSPGRSVDTSGPQEQPALPSFDDRHDGLDGPAESGDNLAFGSMDQPNVSRADRRPSPSASGLPEVGRASPRPPHPGVLSIRESSIALLELHLPSTAKIWNLVDFHEKNLLWYHGCYHGPTFRTELRDTLNHNGVSLSLGDLNLQWVALLFSIMAGSVTCASEDLLSTWGFFKAETPQLSRQWYEATLTCLNLAAYTRDHQIFAVHAITTLSMSAHPLGFSEELTVLLGSALKIAQSLGLNHLSCKHGSEVVDEASSDETRSVVLKREIGRRLWSQLCVQDWFSLPSSGSQLISLNDFTTIKPSNRDHITMAPIPEDYPTYISYGNYLNEIAKLMAEHHVATAESSTPYIRYEQVLTFDKRMRKLAKEIPGYFSVTTPIEPSWPRFILWARRSLTICFAHKMIMIHRTFIPLSFSNPAFQMTRNTCIAAAKTILKEAGQEHQGDSPIIWIDQAFCIAAGIVLCLDMMHQQRDDPARATHRNLIQECITRLQRVRRNTVAFRGAHILCALLAEEEAMTQPVSASRNRRFDGSSSTESSKRKNVDIRKVLGVPSGDFERRGSTLAGLQGAVLSTEADGMSGHSDTPTRRLPQILPPQAGFSNDFLFDELLDPQRNRPAIPGHYMTNI